jgi:hypothetical protein
MRKMLSIFNLRIVCIAVMMTVGIGCMPVMAEVIDSTMVDNTTETMSRYDTRIHKYSKGWAALIPTHVKMQYAGNMGFMSAGFGWDYGRKRQWETDLYLGFLPKYDSNKPKMTFTLREVYVPWSIDLKKSDFSIQPLTCGAYINTIFGHKFWAKQPSKYPSGYWGFSTKLHFNIFLGQAVSYDLSKHDRFLAKQVSLFYELSTCDIYLISRVTNRYLKPSDYLSLSFGVKLQIL